MSDIGKMYQKAVADDMPGIALTDHGNMFGVFKFVAEASKYNKKGEAPVIKPIVGCEFYLVEDRHKQHFTKELKDRRFHQLLLAKNEIGYKNLVKLSSLSFTEGFYSKWARIDKELLLQYHEGIIATSCCIGAIIPQLIKYDEYEKAEEELKWWLEIFGEDYYLELQRHELPAQKKINHFLLQMSEKYNVKTIATNDAHYIEKEDAGSHDILLCINTGELRSTPKKDDLDDESDQRGRRFGFNNNEYYFKTTQEMSQLFSDLPASIENTLEIVDKVEVLDLKKDILLPHFTIPAEFKTQDDYLREITMEGAKSRYIEMTPEVIERINFELGVIERMGFAGYFLIVSDFIKAGRDMGVLIGPGRGSAAGSVVAYCIGITNIDPIKFNLLFERFLNPDRKSMPDIDTDFDDDGRQKVIDYVIDKYGKNQVAQIITYNAMAARSSIKDVARVLGLTTQQSNELAKMLPEVLGFTLHDALLKPLDGESGIKSIESIRETDLLQIKQMRAIYEDNNDIRSEVLREALKLEGSIRNTSVHAAGVIIAPKDIMEIVPLATAKDSSLLVTQYEGKVIEDAGVIKMDFLGLKTLSIIKDCLELIKDNYNLTIDIDKIPFDDQETYELFQRGDTFGTFQFESPQMAVHLRGLKPNRFEDLISMNALYRPGPKQYIGNFIDRKHGRVEVKYDLPEMKEILEETYGITVYQEQVMILAQKLANMTKGQADMLRKAMGKKDRDVLDSMMETFLEGCKANNLDENISKKIWKDWEAFAAYAFNKSHSTCYAYLAFQTAYLKTHYLPEFMAANLIHNNTIEKISEYMKHCKSSGLKVLGPDVNESKINFSVNKEGIIRFGLSAIKGIGKGPSQDILDARKDGVFEDIYDFVARVNYQSVNKKVLESLALSGALDTFGIPRSAYININVKGFTFIEQLIKYALALKDQKEGNVMSLFGDSPADLIIKPAIPEPLPLTKKEELDKEKDLIGLYASGHPLDDNLLEIELMCTHDLTSLSSIEEPKQQIRIAGIVNNAYHAISKRDGQPYCKLEIADFYSTYSIFINNKNYLKYKDLLVNGIKLYITGSIQKKRWQEELEFNVEEIKLLNSIKEEKFKAIVFQIPVEKVSEKLIESMSRIVNEYKGNQLVKLELVDSNTQDYIVSQSSYTLDINQWVVEWAIDNDVKFKVEFN
jgi:DNA polymerase-3 subunit alpha